ncbi:MAG: cytochrome b [Steroidobacteraceae bacterium]|nr:cytochrome b [Steroidobacteraceae bacterium]
MTLRNTTRAWGTLSKSLHWIIVLLILAQPLIANYADSLSGPAKIGPLSLHKSIGITILALAIFRLVWRLANPVPSTGELKTWERVLAKLSHLLLYALIFAMPLTGWMMSSARNFPVSWFNFVQLPDFVQPNRGTYDLMHDLHGALFAVLVVVALLHIAGALKHHFIDKNDVLKRMLPFGGIK